MGRIDKALERIKHRGSENDKQATSQPAERAPNRGAHTVDIIANYNSVGRVTLDRNLLAERRVITDSIDPAILTSYKMLRTRVLQNLKANGSQSIAVTSATQGDGKTITAVNLAISLAGDVNHDVCLVDLDLRHSSVAEYLGIEIQLGISDCLRNNASLPEVMVRPDIDRLIVIPNKRREPNSSELLSSPTMQRLAASLTSDPNRIVIYDMPPVLAADDMLTFAPHVDGVLFVVAEGKTSRTEVLKARELLENTNIIGTVLNLSDEKTATYY